MIIAIDGPAASGKGTLARKLAKHYNLAYMDTGALYRAVAHEVLRTGLSIKDKKDALHAAKILERSIKHNGPDKALSSPALREDKVGIAASKVATMPEIRAALLDIQRNFAKRAQKTGNGAVLDGRDIGTVIVPNADVKLFVTAQDTVRAERRLKELQSKGRQVTHKQILADMRDRDARDVHTLSAHKAKGYQTTILDTSEMGQDEVFEKATQIIDQNSAKV